MTDYQNALELARQYYGPGQNEFLDTIFPELRESEDEGARQFLLSVADQNLEILKSLHTESYIGSKGLCMVSDDIKGWEKARAWLEKQKEPHYSPLCNTIKDKIREYIANHFIADTVVKTDMKSIVKAMEEGVRLGKEEQQPAEWDFPYGENETVDKLIAIAECLEMDGDCLFNGYTGTECGKFLRDLARKQVECKPAEWSEEDEKILERFLGWLQGTIGEKTYSSWLKSLRERFNLQPKQEWSEEDKKLLDLWLDVIDRNDWRMDENFCKASREFINRLKFLRLQPHWKPSEKQMRYLLAVINNPNNGGAESCHLTLESLYNDLKKL